MEVTRPSDEEILAVEQTKAPFLTEKRNFVDSYKAFVNRRESGTEMSETDPRKPNQLGAFVSRLFGRRGEAMDSPPPVPPPMDHLIYQRIQAEAKRNETMSQTSSPEKMTQKTPEKEQNQVEVSVEEVAVPEANEVSEEENEAEQPVGEEGQRERSHEIKADQFADDKTDMASSVGQILQQIHQKTAAAHAAFRRVEAKKDSNVYQFISNLPPLYKKAILGGFAGAIILLVGTLLILN